MTPNDFCVWLKAAVKENNGLPDNLVPSVLANLKTVELALAPLRVVECHYPDRLEDGINL